MEKSDKLPAVTMISEIVAPRLRRAQPCAITQQKSSKTEKEAETLEALVDKHDVGGFIIGLPINMDGSEGPRCQSTRQFASNLLERRDLPLAFWDERLSTVAVERILIDEIDMTRKRRAQVVDKAAATYILQGALNSL